MTREEFGKYDIAFKAIREFGYPSVVLAAFAIGVWLIGATLHESAVVPIVGSHVEFMKATQGVQRQQADALEALAETKENQTVILEEIRHTQHAIRDAVERIHPSIGAPPK